MAERRVLHRAVRGGQLGILIKAPNAMTPLQYQNRSIQQWGKSPYRFGTPSVQEMGRRRARSLFIWVMYGVAKPSKKAADDAEGGGAEAAPQQAGKEGGREDGGTRE